MNEKNELIRITIRFNRRVPIVEFGRLYCCHEYKTAQTRKIIDILYTSDWHRVYKSNNRQVFYKL